MKKTLMALPLLALINVGSVSAADMQTTVTGNIAVSAPVKINAGVNTGILNVNDAQGNPTWVTQPRLSVKNNSAMPVSMYFTGQSGDTLDNGNIKAYDSTREHFIELKPSSSKVTYGDSRWASTEKITAGETWIVGFDSVSEKIEPGNYSYTISVTASNM